ncbi:MAG: sulfatase [Planctomycetota bacterium]
MLLSILVASLPLAPPASGDAPPPPRPNILWLTVEDMSPWIGPYGDTTVPTPHLDAFARDAIRYENAFSGSPVCAPARTALITGMRPTRIGAMHMRTRSRSKAAGDAAYGDLPLYEAVPPPFVRCFPETLRRAGYHVTNNSKTDYQFVAPAWTWDASSRKAHYRARPEGAPFFAVFNHTGTHESQTFPNARERPSAVALQDVPIPPFYPDTPAVRDALKRTYDNIAAMDAWFGRKLAELEESGLADSTIVFFFSDHGVGLPRGKRSVYGTGTRVPLLVRIPEAYRSAAGAPSSPTDRLVSFVDLGPTALSLAGIAPDERLDGRAFLGAHAAPPRDVVFLHADRFDAARDRTRAITDGRRLVVHNLMRDVPHLIANAYRERIPMTHDLYALREGGALASSSTAAQWQVASTERPSTEWYDRAEDPWEVVDLARAPLAPADRGPFERLDQALREDRDGGDDLGLLDDEAEMVRSVLWRGAAEQPTTAAPVCRVELDAGGGRPALRVTCATEGASIGVRPGEGAPWRVYDPARPAFPAGASTVDVCAHRIGYRPSEVARVAPR